MITVTNLENFTKECSKLFCKIAYPRKIIICDERSLVKRHSFLRKSEETLAFCSAGLILNVVYNRVVRDYNSIDTLKEKYANCKDTILNPICNFRNYGNYIGYIICHELSHLEQNVNQRGYDEIGEYRLSIETVNDYNTSTILLNNFDFYNSLLNKYFNTSVDKDTLRLVQKESLNILPVKKFKYERCTTIKELLDRDLKNLLYNDTYKNIVIDSFISMPKYYVSINLNNENYIVGKGEVYCNNYTDFERIEKLLEILNGTKSFKAKIWTDNEEEEVGKLLIFIS